MIFTVYIIHCGMRAHHLFKRYYELLAKRAYFMSMSDEGIENYGKAMQNLCDDVLQLLSQQGYDIASSYKSLFHYRKLTSRMLEVKSIMPQSRSIAINQIYTDLLIDIPSILSFIKTLSEKELLNDGD
ncbi:MAG: hypothetical protein JWN76_3773 [Chitinophagaceae bacterium]|nr:hypothetical protein [Chitinophagaceae bacterium]